MLVKRKYSNLYSKLTISKAHSYQYTFAPNPNWSSFYAPAPEIRQYLEDVVKRFSVDRFIKCSHKVVGAQWDDKKAKWYS
jgi:cation diffusion facilitator CzcD-associated flavoprotein CzcO